MLNSSHASHVSHISSRAPSFRSTARRGLTAAAVLVSSLAALAGARAAEPPAPPTLHSIAKDQVELRLHEPSVTHTAVTFVDDGPGGSGGGSLVLPPGTSRLRFRTGAVIPRLDLARAQPRPLEAPSKLLPGAECDFDWKSLGGNARRNGAAASIGPGKPKIRWSGLRPSIVAWPAFFDGKMGFTVRQTSFEEPGGSLVVAFDRTTGEELWVRDVPYEAGDWSVWIAGANDGKVYASRAGNGGSVSAPVYALSANDGSILWQSEDETNAGVTDGAVFADNGDLIVGDFDAVLRIRATDGETVWRSPRVCFGNGSCGAALGPGQAVYVADTVTGGHRIVRYDATTGERLYESEVMPGAFNQADPFVGPYGSVYLARTQNYPATDFLYAFDDTGSQLVPRWSRPSAWVPFSVHAAAADGTIYMAGPGYELLRVDAASGATLDTAGSIAVEGQVVQLRMAVDAEGKLYVSDGVTSPATFGALYAFNPDLSPRWAVKVDHVNLGGPAVGGDGFLTVAGIGTDFRAYKNARSRPACP